MFLTIQYPITDLRNIVGSTNKLKKPVWNDPDLESQLRYFGSVVERETGGVLQWPADGKFCNSGKAINLKELTHKKVPFNGKTLRFSCRFRRFFKSDDFTSRYEMAFTTYEPIKSAPANNADEKKVVADNTTLDAVIDAFLKIDVKIARTGKKKAQDKSPKEFNELSLYEAGDKIAELYLNGSTKNKLQADNKSWWIKAGEPMLLLTFLNNENIILSPSTRSVIKFEEHGIALYFLQHRVAKNRSVRCWLISLDSSKKTQNSVAFLRQLKLNLFRINAEKEYLRQIENTVSTNDLEIKDEKLKKSLSDYLEKSTANLLKKKRFGIDQDGILHYAFRSEETVDSESQQKFLSHFELLENKFLLKNVEKLTQQKREIKIFVASSAEVKAERDECVLAINKIKTEHQHLYLIPFGWENDMPFANYPGNPTIQDAINPELKESELIIFIFYSRLGVHTLEEFEYANEQKRNYVVYFKKGFTADAQTGQAYDKLLEFKQSLNETVVYQEYTDMKEFTSLLTLNLNKLLSDRYPATTGANT